MASKKNKKELGQVFTPYYIVEKILDEVGYTSSNLNILNKKILEPSCGDGAFMVEIVGRLISACKNAGKTAEEIMGIVNKNIYGCEIDEEHYESCISALNSILLSYGIDDFIWENIVCTDTLSYVPDVKFDYIVGNPPYVRIHNIPEETRENIKALPFSEGMADMYVLFFGICLGWLNDNGKLGFITPNSYFKNTSQRTFRKYLLKNHFIEKIIDFGSSKIFENADTYTAITIMSKVDKELFSYSFSNGINLKYSTKINYSDMYDTDKKEYTSLPWVFASNGQKTIFDKSKYIMFGDMASVQYGISTNADKIYIIKPIRTNSKYVEFIDYLGNKRKIERGFTRGIIKGSRLDTNSLVIFPYRYDKAGALNIVSENEIQTKFPYAYKYLKDNKDVLNKRDMDSGAEWYQFARSQGLKNLNREKIVVKQILSGEDNKLEGIYCDKDIMVYSGIFITPKNGYSMDDICGVLRRKDFYEYLFAAGKDMSGGYRSITPKMMIWFPVKRK